MNRTTHAHCSTTVYSTSQLSRAFTHLMQESLHVLQNRLNSLKKTKVLIFVFFLHFTDSSSEIKTVFLFLEYLSVTHFTMTKIERKCKVQNVF